MGRSCDKRHNHILGVTIIHGMTQESSEVTTMQMINRTLKKIMLPFCSLFQPLTEYKLLMINVRRYTFHFLMQFKSVQIKLGEGVEIREELLRGVKWGDYRKVTRGLAAALFSPIELATCSVTGQRWSRAGQESRPTKPPLDRRRVHALISYVSRHFPDVEVSRIKQVLAYKCKENCAALRMRTAR